MLISIVESYFCRCQVKSIEKKLLSTRYTDARVSIEKKLTFDDAYKHRRKKKQTMLISVVEIVLCKKNFDPSPKSRSNISTSPLRIWWRRSLLCRWSETGGTLGLGADGLARGIDLQFRRSVLLPSLAELVVDIISFGTKDIGGDDAQVVCRALGG